MESGFPFARWARAMKRVLGLGSRRLHAWVLAIVLSAGAAAFAQKPDLEASAEKADLKAPSSVHVSADRRLSRGVNLSHWFAQSDKGYGAEHLSSYVSKDELTRLRRAGFTHVRLPVAMDRSFQDDATGEAYRTKLIEKISEINDAGMAAVVDIHPDEPEKRALLDAGQDSFFVEGWRRLAGSLAVLDHRQVLFEIMNEPHPLTGAQWRDLQERAIEAIRTVAPHNSIIANPGGWSSIGDYDDFKPLSHSNIIYTAHIYEPILFTHQGASWTWEVAAQVAELEWPLMVAAAAERAKRAGLTEEAVKHLHFQIATGQFEEEWLLRRFDKLADWQRRSGNPPVYIGEFGVFQKVAPEDARLQWHVVTRRAFEERKWGWAVWDYAGGYGIAKRSGETRAFDQAMLRTLGLHSR